MPESKIKRTNTDTEIKVQKFTTTRSRAIFNKPTVVTVEHESHCKLPIIPVVPKPLCAWLY